MQQFLFLSMFLFSLFGIYGTLYWKQSGGQRQESCLSTKFESLVETAFSQKILVNDGERADKASILKEIFKAVLLCLVLLGIILEVYTQIDDRRGIHENHQASKISSLLCMKECLKNCFSKMITIQAGDNKADSHLPHNIKYYSFARKRIITVLPTHFEQYLQDKQCGIPKEELMRHEWARYASFESFPARSPALPSQLAKAGFYYVGTGDRVSCFSCKISHSGWKGEDNPHGVHQLLSPECQFLQKSETRNISIHEQTTPNPTDIIDFVANSESDTEDNTSNSTARCGNNAGIWSNDVDFDEGSLAELPKHPQYKEFADRLSSYSKWPFPEGHDPPDLSEAGFFYAGFGDCVRCFFCGLALRNWEYGDVPWAEHARWSPDCTYLRRRRGFGFTVEFGEQRGSSSLNGASAPRKDTENGGRKDGLKRTENSTPTQNSKITTNEAIDQIKKDLLNMGFDRQKVEMAILMHENNGNSLTVSDILDTVLSICPATNTSAASIKHSLNQETVSANAEASGTVESPTSRERNENDSNVVSVDYLQAENRRLKDQLICKICMDREACTVLLPCSHMVSCEVCSPSLQKCPICRKRVKKRVRAFLS